MRTPTRTRRAAAGFTLLELVAALTMGLMLAGTALQVYTLAGDIALRAAARSQLSRDADLMMDLLGRDIRFMGAGVPAGQRLPPTSSPSNQLRPLIRVGLPNQLVFVGDLPYPNADYNGVMYVTQHVSPTNPDHHVAVVSELSGTCAPTSSSAAAPCDSTVGSLARGEASFGAGDRCTEANVMARTCPWGLNKYQRDASGQTAAMVYGQVDGDWSESRWDIGDIHNHGDRLWFRPETDVSDWNALVVPFGSGFISQVDRVFWNFEQSSGHVTRKQCWGPIGDPGASGWPPVQNSAVTNPILCGSTSALANGTPWETVMTGVEAFTFRYFTQVASPETAHSGPWTLAAAGDVRAVEVEFTLARKVGKQTLRQKARRRFLIENRGGIHRLPNAQGGSSTQL